MRQVCNRAQRRRARGGFVRKGPAKARGRLAVAGHNTCTQRAEGRGGGGVGRHQMGLGKLPCRSESGAAPADGKGKAALPSASAGTPGSTCAAVSLCTQTHRHRHRHRHTHKHTYPSQYAVALLSSSCAASLSSTKPEVSETSAKPGSIFSSIYHIYPSILCIYLRVCLSTPVVQYTPIFKAFCSSYLKHKAY